MIRLNPCGNVLLICFLPFYAFISSCGNSSKNVDSLEVKPNDCIESVDKASDLLFHSIGRLEFENRNLGVLDSAEMFFIKAASCPNSGHGEYFKLIRFFYIKHEYDRALKTLDSLPSQVRKEENELYWKKLEMLNAYFGSDSSRLFKGWTELDSLFRLEYPDYLIDFDLAYERLGYLHFYSNDVSVVEDTLVLYADKEIYDTLFLRMDQINEDFFKSPYVDQVRIANGL